MLTEKEKELFSNESSITVEDLSHPPEIHKDVKPWIEKIEEDVVIPKQVSDAGVTAAGPTTKVLQKPKITLPLSAQEEEKALHLKLNLALRWLAEWCLRQAKIAHAKIRGFDN